jgi:hypothetical protein
MAPDTECFHVVCHLCLLYHLCHLYDIYYIMSFIPFMLSVIMLSIVMLNVVVPL